MLKLNPRDVYGRKLTELGETDERIVVVTADLAKSNKLLDFRDRFPDRFFNVGIAEQNLMGVAAGLALEGKIPVASTFAAFASMRAHEQVRSDIGYVDLPVKILATTSGLTAGIMGPTHQGNEDIAVMRTIPNMTVLAPSDPLQVSEFIELAIGLPGPVYIRVGRGEDPVLYGEDQKIEIGKAIVAREGTDVSIVACGTMMKDAIQAHEQLASEGVSARVLDFHTVKPLDRDAIIAAARETGTIVTVEDHFVTGGLGSAVAEVVAEEGLGARVRRLGVPDVFAEVGVPDELYRHYGYDAAGIVATVRDLILPARRR
ncbi:transketolase family protein [Kribbella speibonae]|uniref:Transketolase family protein n=2 Tax=Kribbella speibonae TaxID=1572660 RepID=A0A4R0IY32_9ACTN|nr:transketolase family protein [Kribbella speibonae]